MADFNQNSTAGSLKQEIERQLNHRTQVDEKPMQIAVKKLANNKKFLGTKSEKLAHIKKIGDEMIIRFFRQQKNKKRVADDIKLLTKLPLLHRAKTSKEDVALVVFYIAEILYSCDVRVGGNKEIGDCVNPFRDAYAALMSEVREQIEANNKNYLIKQSPEELSRLFLEGGGKLPDDELLRTCPFCSHSYVDEPATNAAVMDRNKALAADFDAKMREYRSNNGHYTNAVGERSNRTPPKPQYKHEVLQCHCHQIRCLDAAGNGSCRDCNTNGSKLVANGNGNCNCQVCSCTCNSAYKKNAVNLISVNKGAEKIADKENVDTGNAVAGKAIGSIFAASATEAHAAQAAVIHARNGKTDASDAFHTENLYFQGASRRLMVDPSINLSSLRDFAGTAVNIALPGGAVFDTRLLGKDNGGFRARNNRLNKLAVAASNGHGSLEMGPPAPRNTTSAATISPIPASTAVVATPPAATLPTLGPFDPSSSEMKKPPPKKYQHKIPISATMKTFLSVNAAVNGGVKMPSAMSQAQVDQLQEIIDVPDDEDDLSVLSVTSFKRQKTDDTPATAMVNETINSVVECAYNPIIDVDSPASPDSALGRDVAHIIDLPFKNVRKIARGILKRNKDAGPEDLKRLLDQAYPFPSSIKKKKKKAKKGGN